MIKLVLLVLLLIGFNSLVCAQGFIEHTVKEGETVQDVIYNYEVSPYELYQLNPDAKEGLVPGNVLVFLRSKNYPFDPKFVGVIKHKVKRKETLFSIAKNYNLDLNTIKKFNPKLYSEGIQKGDKVDIPKFSEQYVRIQPKEEEVVSQDIEHTVMPKETKYGIAHKYQITIEELEEQNPQIKDGLKIGQIVKIKTKVEQDNTSQVENEVINVGYSYYEVQPKEGFYRLSKKLGISKDSLIALNPQLSDGIKLGMVLKYPLAKKDYRDSYSLLDSLSNFSERKVTLLLPLRLNFIKITDSTSNLKKLILKKNSIMNRSIDFYSGALVAIDSLKGLGVPVKLTVLDTEFGKDKVKNGQRINNLLNREYQENEVVVGPLANANIDSASKVLNKHNVPLVVPFGSSNIEGLPNMVYLSSSSTITKKEAMLKYLDTYSKGKNIIIVADEGVKLLRDEIAKRYPTGKVVKPRKGDLLIPEDFRGVLSEEIENVVIIEATKVGLVQTLTSILDTKLKKHSISLFTTTSQKHFENKSVENRFKVKLKYHFPSESIDVGFEPDNQFVANYKKRFGKLPTKYALKGFDVVLDVLLRQGVGNGFEDSMLLAGETKYIENKFKYTKTNSGPYENKAVYILTYTEDYNLIEVVPEVEEQVQDNNIEIKE